MDRKFDVVIHKYLTDFAKYTTTIHTYSITHHPLPRRQMPRVGMLWRLSNDKPIL
jgi:hypothetical protein